MLSQGCPFRWGQHWQMALPYVGAHLTRCALELPRAGNMSFVYICIVSVVLRWKYESGFEAPDYLMQFKLWSLACQCLVHTYTDDTLVVLTRATQNVNSQAPKANQHEQTTWNCNLLVCMLSSEFYSCSYWLLHCHHKQCSSGPTLYMYVWCMYVCMYVCINSVVPSAGDQWRVVSVPTSLCSNITPSTTPSTTPGMEGLARMYTGLAGLHKLI